ncbi:hypothetical protein [Erythrobacter sp.]|uniref:Vgb family protein n=1 Tax=Erythrobacter sp. TaxID=1042 RepID=UPI001B1B3A95|nr:hypothetical protein [Erythrobacter sp.]MBO6526638.1 hypothetical protein [Erythrobacter sp.]MBO6529152.1 hypothetical protein [Erythrobacter sp.]
MRNSAPMDRPAKRLDPSDRRALTACLPAALFMLAAPPSAHASDGSSPDYGANTGTAFAAMDHSLRAAIDTKHTITLPPRVEWPNGIAFDGEGRLLVGAITAPVIARFESGAWTEIDVAAPGIFSVTSLTHDPRRNLVWGTSPAFLDEDSDQQNGLYALEGEELGLVRFLRLPDDGFANDTEMAVDGRLLVTDSVNGRILAYEWERDAFEVLVEDERLRPLNRVGAAGVTVDPQGRVYVANYETGALLILADGALRPIALARPLENPDGLALTEDGALLVAEGAVQSGNGRLLRIPEPSAPGPRPVETASERIESPVNLTVGPDGVAYVTESRIRRKIGPDPTEARPYDFRVIVSELAADAGQNSE